MYYFDDDDDSTDNGGYGYYNKQLNEEAKEAVIRLNEATEQDIVRKLNIFKKNYKKLLNSFMFLEQKIDELNNDYNRTKDFAINKAIYVDLLKQDLNNSFSYETKQKFLDEIDRTLGQIRAGLVQYADVKIQVGKYPFKITQEEKLKREMSLMPKWRTTQKLYDTECDKLSQYEKTLDKITVELKEKKNDYETYKQEATKDEEKAKYYDQNKDFVDGFDNQLNNLKHSLEVYINKHKETNLKKSILKTLKASKIKNKETELVTEKTIKDLIYNVCTKKLLNFPDVQREM